MFRRCLTAVLVMGYLACQMAAVPHAHAFQAADHDLRAHVHLNWFVGFHEETSTATRKSTNDHGHSRHGGHRGLSQDEQPTNPVLANHDESDHDATCIYVPHDEHVSASAMSSFPACLDLTTAFASWDASAVLCSHATPAAHHAPPEDLLVGGCALILRLRTLRI
jgi:hypothetical protein